MKKYAIAAALAFLVTPAAAAQFDVSMTGVLTSQTGQGNDQNLSIGSIFTLSASFQDAYLLPYTQGNAGDQIIGFYGLPDSSFSITAPGLAWDVSDSIFGPWGTSPSIVVNGDKVVGLIGDLSSGDPGLKPQLMFWRSNPTFVVTAPDHAQKARSADISLDYQTPGFSGVWDFANSSVVDPPSPQVFSFAEFAAVPEPATWAMFLLGFAAIGWTLRKSSKQSTI